MTVYTSTNWRISLKAVGFRKTASILSDAKGNIAFKVFKGRIMSMYEINLCCPDCGSYKWETTETSGEYVCAECKATHTPNEMDVQAFLI